MYWQELHSILLLLKSVNPCNKRLFVKNNEQANHILFHRVETGKAKSGWSVFSTHSQFRLCYYYFLFCVMPNGDASAAHGTPQQSIPLGPWGVPDLHVTQTKQEHSTTQLSASAERKRESLKSWLKWMRENRKEGWRKTKRRERRNFRGTLLL